MRLKVLERDGWRCQECGDKKTMLCVHHRYYESGKDPWEYPPEALVTLCENCHKTETVDTKKWQDELLVVLAKQGFDSEDLMEIVVSFALHHLPYPPTVIALAMSVVFCRPELAEKFMDIFIDDFRERGHGEHADSLIARRTIPERQKAASE